MPETFDYYYRWLGIPPDEQPPDHYRLLGIRVFEHDADVIDTAANRQMAHVRTYQTGPQVVLSQKLLNEIARARACLLDARTKASYDEELRLRRGGPAVSSSPTAAGRESLAISVGQRSARSASLAPARDATSFAVWQMVKIFGGGVVGLALGYVAVYFITGNDMFGVLPQRGKRTRPEVLVTERPIEPKPGPGRDKESAQERIVKPKRAASEAPAPPSISPANPTPEPKPEQAPFAPAPASQATSSAPQPAAIPPPAATTPTPAPVVEALDVLASVGEAWRLPELSSSAAVKVAALARAPEEPLILSLRSGAANLPAKGMAIVEPAADGRSWAISYMGESGSSAKTAVANLRREGLDLTFGWAIPPADGELRRQLANCLLEICCGSTVRSVQLREIHAAGPLVLDLTDDKQAIDLPLEGLPKLETVRMEIRELANFPTGAAVRGGAKALALGKQAVIEFAEPAGAEIGLRFERLVASGHLAVRVEPVFREGRGKFDLTLKQLEKTKAAAEIALARANQNLGSAAAAQNQARSAVQSLESNRPAADNLQARAVWEPQYKAAVSALSRAADRAGDLQRQIKEHQERLTAVPKMRTFLDSLHQRAAIRYMICAESSGRDIVLVDGTSPGGATGAQ